jgi:hypothetical protein
MAPRDDSPPLILRVTARGISPASAIDLEILAGLPIDSVLEVRVLREAPSKALRAWWFLLGETVKLDPQTLISARALSNEILLKHHLVEEEAVIGGTIRKPMSLTAFTEQELWRLVEAAKLVITAVYVPGLDVEAMLDHAKKG